MYSKRKCSAVGDEDRQGKQPRATVRAELRQDLLNESVIEKLRNAWACSEGESKESDVEVIREPFKLCVVKQFLSDLQLCGSLKESFLEHSLKRKECDLFSFYQSEDLSTFHDPDVAELLSFLETECRDWVRSVTGLALDGGVSATLSVYDHGDHLLCHDDKFEERSVAFILYLNSDWKPHFGGELQIFNTYENNLPKDIVRSILPENNTFVFFQVTDNSFHQVAEVLVENDLRVTINGWFHEAEAIEAAPVPTVIHQSHPGPRELAQLPGTSEGIDVADMVNPKYLSEQAELRGQFEADSEMLLPSFLREEVYQKIAEELCGTGTVWSPLYLPDHRKYDLCEASAAGSQTRRLLSTFTSSSFLSYLEGLTGLALTPGAAASQPGSSATTGPRCHCELQCWHSGCYSLAKDSDFQVPSGVLELHLFFNCDDVSSDVEGSITYIAANEEEKLLTVVPVNNTAAFVFRDDGTANFVKYITSKYSGRHHVISCSYFE